jgi:DNA-binding LytR/AlgR family response regulator
MGNEFQRLDIQLKASILFLNIDQIDFLESAGVMQGLVTSNM